MVTLWLNVYSKCYNSNGSYKHFILYCRLYAMLISFNMSFFVGGDNLKNTDKLELYQDLLGVLRIVIDKDLCNRLCVAILDHMAFTIHVFRGCKLHVQYDRFMKAYSHMGY